MPSTIEWIETDRQTFATLCESFHPGELPGWAGVLPIQRWSADESTGPSGRSEAPREYLVYALTAPGQAAESTLAATPQIVATLGDGPPERVYALRIWHFYERARLAVPDFLAHLAEHAPTGWTLLEQTFRAATDGLPEDNGMAFRAFEIDLAIDDRFLVAEGAAG